MTQTNTTEDRAQLLNQPPAGRAEFAIREDDPNHPEEELGINMTLEGDESEEAVTASQGEIVQLLRDAQKAVKVMVDWQQVISMAATRRRVLVTGLLSTMVFGCAQEKAATQSAANVAVRAAQNTVPHNLVDVRAIKVVNSRSVGNLVRQVDIVLTLRTKVDHITMAKYMRGVNAPADLKDTARSGFHGIFGAEFDRGSVSTAMYSVTLVKIDGQWGASTVHSQMTGTHSLDFESPATPS